MACRLAQISNVVTYINVGGAWGFGVSWWLALVRIGLIFEKRYIYLIFYLIFVFCLPILSV